MSPYRRPIRPYMDLYALLSTLLLPLRMRDGAEEDLCVLRSASRDLLSPLSSLFLMHSQCSTDPGQVERRVLAHQLHRAEHAPARRAALHVRAHLRAPHQAQGGNRLTAYSSSEITPIRGSFSGFSISHVALIGCLIE
jgi:hypothetical protein